MLGVMCLVALLRVGMLVSLGFVCSGIFCLYIMCYHVCSVFYWLIGDVLLMYSGVVILRLHLPCFDACWSFGVAGLGWYPCSRLKPATRIPTQPSHTETPTHIETRTHVQCGDTIETSQAPDDGCINVRNMLSIEEVK